MKDDSILSLGGNARMVIKDYLLAETDNIEVSAFKMFSGEAQTLLGRVFRGNTSQFRRESVAARLHPRLVSGAY